MSLKHDLLILGSQNSKVEDQDLTRDQIRPVQILRRTGELEEVSFFNLWGKVGVSSIAWHHSNDAELFVSDNENIFRVNSETGEYLVLEIPQLGDIHDIHIYDGILTIANTEYDEVVFYDLQADKVTDRLSLTSFREELDKTQFAEGQVKDRFHCNQAFLDYNGNLCALIHNITGWQYYRIVLEMLVRRQGDGGVINLETGEIKHLKLQSPHTVRLINNEYWIQDSSDKSTKIYDKNWKLIDSIETNGFGRGMDFSVDNNIGYVGVSATRKRYLRVIPTNEKLSNRVMTVDLESKTGLGTYPIPNIEQMDNVYILEENLKAQIEGLQKFN